MTSQVNTTDEIKPSKKNNNNIDLNQNVFTVTVDENESKKTSERSIIDTEDNWIAKVLYGGPIGYTVNFILLIVTIIILVFTVHRMWSDEGPNRTLIEESWLKSIIQFFVIIVPMDTAICFSIVLIVFPLSRLSRSTIYYWFLGVTSSASIMIAIWFVRDYGNIGTRLGLSVDWCRLSMKIAAFLVECNWSEQVHEKSSMKSLLYFIYIPHLRYQHEYPLARRIRWLKVLSHILWLLFGGALALLIHYLTIPFFCIDLLTVDLGKLALLAVTIPLVMVFGYLIFAWFFLFENFCGACGEILRFPDLKFFGTFPQVITGNDPVTDTNTIVSKWFSRYIYIPIVKNGGSRFKGLWFVMAVSIPAHDFVYMFMGDIFVSYSLFLSLGLAPLALLYQPESRVKRFILALIAGLGLAFWGGSWFLEFLAWNYSSQPDLDKLSRFRLIPLFIEQLYHNFEEKFQQLIK